MVNYYYTDGKERFGPFTVEGLRDKKITRDTLVWKEGLTDWVPARNLSDLETLFFEAIPEIPPMGAPYMTPPQSEVMPKNWLVESILITLFCCLPFGIVSIVYATKVETLWNAGQRDEAMQASLNAGKWVRIGFFSGIAAMVIYLIMIFLGVIAGFGSANQI